MLTSGDDSSDMQGRGPSASLARSTTERHVHRIFRVVWSTPFNSIILIRAPPSVKELWGQHSPHARMVYR